MKAMVGVLILIGYTQCWAQHAQPYAGQQAYGQNYGRPAYGQQQTYGQTYGQQQSYGQQTYRQPSYYDRSAFPPQPAPYGSQGYYGGQPRYVQPGSLY